MKALPTLQALRMCHRFGRGPDVYVTKLPVEIEQRVEEMVVGSSSTIDYEPWSLLSTWEDQFECFESRCEPMSHLVDANSPLSDQAGDEFEPCEGCEDYVYDGDCENYCKATESKDRCDGCKSGPDPDLCERSCAAKKSDLKNQLATDWEWQDCHTDVCAEWLRRIDQADGGGFVKHAEVSERCCRKKVGLR